jgi:hypothetical protein
MTDPRASIVAYIRGEASQREAAAQPSASGNDVERHTALAQFLELDRIAREIETYADLKRPEPTIPAKVWMKEGNLR